MARAAVLAGAVAIPLAIAAVPAHAATGPSSGSAFAIAADGPVSIPPTPAVASSGPNTVSRSVLEVPSNPVLQARALHASAGKGHARASVADVRIPRIDLTASLISAKCVQGRGTSHLVKVKLNGKVIKAQPTRNAGVNVAVDGLGTVSVVLNKQVRDAQRRLTVTAVELTLPVGTARQTISIASATCGKGGHGHPKPGPGKPEQPGKPGHPPAPPSAPPSGQAPAPTPVPGDLPVTG
jgi:hypothetical protein